MALIEERREDTLKRDAVPQNNKADREVAAATTSLLGREHLTGAREAISFSLGSQSVPAQSRVGYASASPAATGDGGIADVLRARSRWVWLRGSSQPSVAYHVAKRLLDIVCAIAALVVLFPLLLLVGVAIVLEDGGPVLYYQPRIGRDGEPFRFYKFRSMIRDADAAKDLLAKQNEASGPIFKMKNDPRITRVGRFLRRSSIDELPQLLNVLRGDMSFVGPRPHLPREVERYTDRQHRRLTVQPGLVCLREVYGRSNLTFDQWVEMDLLYIENRSLLTDLGILARLLPAVFRGEGAY